MVSALTAFRVATHVGLFLLAVVVFYLGLGIGLSQSPMYGNLLFLTALAIASLNVWWMVRRPRRRKRYPS